MLVNKLGKKGTDLLGVKYPIIAGAMTWVSDSDLTAAVSNAGGFGVLAGGSMPPEILKEEIAACFEKTKLPFGVNLITVSPVFKDQLEIVLNTDVPVVVIAGGLPTEDMVKPLKDKGKKVLGFAPTFKWIKHLKRFGVDGIIIEGHEAGGHIGPVSTMVLIQEILFNEKEIPIFIAGGIGSGKMMAHLLLMGAAGIQLGTRFVLSDEANVHPDAKDIFKRAEARDAVVSFGIDRQLPVIPVRGLKNKGHEEFMQLQMETLEKVKKEEMSSHDGAVQVEKFWLGALKRGVKDGDTDTGSLMAGTSVGLFKDIKPVKAIVEEYVTEAEATLQEVSDLTK